jgi:uncharacterized coiled-coil DUF342 family protein
LKTEIEKVNELIAQENSVITNKSDTIENHKKSRDALNEEYNQLKAKRNKAGDRRKELWRQESEMETELNALRDGTPSDRMFFSIILVFCLSFLSFSFFILIDGFCCD